MKFNNTENIIKKADRVVSRCDSRDPQTIAGELGIHVRMIPFKKQKGVYTVIERNRFIFIKEDLPENMKKIVLLHEIGHDQLHRREALHFQEFNLFDHQENRLELEANLFAAQVSLPDEEILELIRCGYPAEAIAAAMHSDVNLIALKTESLNRRGFDLHPPAYSDSFLKPR